MPDIKTKSSQGGGTQQAQNVHHANRSNHSNHAPAPRPGAVGRTIRVLDKSAIVAQKMKQVFIRTKDKLSETTEAESADSPIGYSQEELQQGFRRIGAGTGSVLTGSAKRVRRKVKASFRQSRQLRRERRRTKAKTKIARNTPAQTPPQPISQTIPSINGRRLHAAPRQNPPASRIRVPQRTVGRAAKGTVKAAPKAIKTAQQTARTTVKTADAVAKTAHRTAQATEKAVRVTVQAMKAAARAAAQAAKAAAKAVSAAVKAIIAGAKALFAAIAAGGWVAVVIVVVICLVGLFTGSCFGIFFSNEDTGSTVTLRDVIREISRDYQEQLDTIKNSVSYDRLEMSGSRGVWPEVLSVYAVKTTTDPECPQEVASMTDEKRQLLTDLFWEMNQISHRTETSTETVIVEVDDGEGGIIQEEIEQTVTTLYIRVSHKTANEMAASYHFTADQRDQLADLLSDENNSLWLAVLYGVYGSDDAIVMVAQSQLGNVGGEPYWSWYGFDSRVSWCACFVSWCANECGYIESGVIPKYAACDNGIHWFQERDLWADNSIVPEPGMIIFFDWDDRGNSGPQDGVSDHTGIVEKVEGSTVYTIEGNAGDTCAERHYPVGHYEILGYGMPAY